ncbi:type II toxin-antitoxin system PemI/MazE family antitoxin [Listeria innocua]|uniref:type II toxin-antitoxin system PemI/MazE family antitoxin n=1 Tax=Listeria innocua TaxID=1642 RepID=UPI001626E271|nr:AbrB/MazE/SpoVT family DNA-binding domain-containing protein [Listeria innocua]EBF5152439.1 AbrB/MazE/SpoVT family DNA-binding domain-containing protein [Listeria monocytogenes]MBC2137631.1 AbrB/MazE/SpoVT family DNA-binding domain-containing protein [Listeria innocua]MBC2140564.1 AbrB/MazE/SpoVT family DNA-binding domain-containing protein [Listeria innocua]MBC2238796.1 AbrB/MazE/SpoVT family DNA-binding domain-containing protein [Listeria innocua]
MLETKLRKQGNALMITIPASLKQKGRQIHHVVQEDGSIRLVPKRNNIYQNVEIGAYEQVEEWSDDLFHGREMI